MFATNMLRWSHIYHALGYTTMLLQHGHPAGSMGHDWQRCNEACSDFGAACYHGDCWKSAETPALISAAPFESWLVLLLLR